MVGYFGPIAGLLLESPIVAHAYVLAVGAELQFLQRFGGVEGAIQVRLQRDGIGGRLSGVKRDEKSQSSGSREPGKYSRANWRRRCVETRSASPRRSKPVFCV